MDTIFYPKMMKTKKSKSTLSRFSLGSVHLNVYETPAEIDQLADKNKMAMTGQEEDKKGT